MGGARGCGIKPWQEWQVLKPEQGGVAGKVGGARGCGIKPWQVLKPEQGGVAGKVGGARGVAYHGRSGRY